MTDDERAAIEAWNALPANIKTRLANSSADYMAHARNKTLDEGTAAARWLTASLLAVNGGGAIAALNIVEKLTRPGLVGGLFVAGLMAAMLSGYLLQHFNYGAVDLLANRAAYWAVVGERGTRDPETEGPMDDAQSRFNRLALCAPLAGWLSAMLFLAACITIGCTYSGKQATSAGQVSNPN